MCMCSELHEPAVTSSNVKASPSRPGPSAAGQPTPEGAEYLVQHRKDTWRGSIPLQSAGTSPHMYLVHAASMRRRHRLCANAIGKNKMTMNLTFG